MMNLTEKQIRFCEEYLIDLNASQAAIRTGYSEKTAKEQGSRLLTNANIQNYIQERRKQIAGTLNITQERVLKEYARIAFQDVRKFYNEDGSLKEVTELDDDAAAVLAGMDVDEIFEIIDGKKVKIGVTKKIKRWEKVKALDSLGKHLGLFEGLAPLSGKKITVTISE